MDYQEAILKEYRETFPDKTLKTTSAETGIQMTRVFRIFNGSPMKLREYEAFEKTIKQKRLSSSKFELLSKFQNCLTQLRDPDLAYIEIELEHLVKTRTFINRPFAEIAGLATAQ